MKFTDEQHAEKLAEMCNIGVSASCLKNGDLIPQYCPLFYLRVICPHEKISCTEVKPGDWMKYLSRFPLKNCD